MASEEPTQTDSARPKLLQGVWTSLRSIKLDGEDMETKLAKWAPRSPSDDDNEGGGTLENVVRTIFGSCTALGDENDDEESMSLHSDRRRERSRSSRRRDSSSASARARQAVNNLREKEEQRETSPSYRNKPSVSRPFPASSPNKGKQGKHEVPYLLHEIGPPPPPPNIPDLGAGGATFDDGISAISAHTLEELDRQTSKQLNTPDAACSNMTAEQGFEASIKNTVSNESSLFPPTALTEGEERDCVGESMSPIDFSRGRSNNTWGSKGSRRTFQSMSTASTDFEKVWLQQEQQYWQDTVEKDEKKKPLRKGSVRNLNMVDDRDMRVRSRSREQDIFPLKQDGTITTAGSSAFSGMSSPQYSHPHDTMPLDPSDFVPVSVRSPGRLARDPDRIQEFMAVDAHTEIGEI